ncbi:MAG: hypothetical protein Q7R56_02130 [Nanoarchaeota archaeon]|nr:hypothetical protein [Nanoarchaeota archaeon]
MSFLQKLFLHEEKKDDNVDGKPSDPGKLAGDVFRLSIDAPASGVERYYFWVIRLLEKSGPYGLNFYGDVGEIIKVRDVYSSAETSAYWGNVEQKKAAQQDRVSSYLANIGKFIKDLFQIVRELRILDERLGYYDGIVKNDQNSKAADIALKGIWVDLVEGGGKNPSSVYGLASQVGFVTLPDLFFDTFVRKKEDVSSSVAGYEKMGINRKVREVLMRKLEQYLLWREHTDRELRQRRKFVLSYLAQEFNVIKMYALWLKPYLQNVRKLQQSSDLNKYDIVTAFDTSKIELELLAVRKKDPKSEKDFVQNIPVLRIRFSHVAIPQMSFQQEFQRGAIHTGHTKIVIDSFVASQDSLRKYQQVQDGDVFDVLTAIDETVGALKDDLEKYLTEAATLYNLKELKAIFPEKPKDNSVKSSDSLFDPFKAIFSGFAEIGKAPFMWSSGDKAKVKKEKKPLSSLENLQEAALAKDIAKVDAKVLYAVFKKAHRMLTP